MKRVIRIKVIPLPTGILEDPLDCARGCGNVNVTACGSDDSGYTKVYGRSFLCLFRVNIHDAPLLSSLFGNVFEVE